MKNSFYLNGGGRAGFSSYNLDHLFSLKSVFWWRVEIERTHERRFLDVGCGHGKFLADIVGRSIPNLASFSYGIDIFPLENPTQLRFLQMNVDGEDLPFPAECMRFVSCNHVLEHIFYTERLLREMKRILHPKGIAVLSVPNIGSWHNRVLGLLGYQPTSSEVGIERGNYGTHAWLRERNATAAGHIRSFSPRAFADLVESCGFSILDWWKPSQKPESKFTKWSGPDMGVVCR